MSPPIILVRLCDSIQLVCRDLSFGTPTCPHFKVIIFFFQWGEVISTKIRQGASRSNWWSWSHCESLINNRFYSIVNEVGCLVGGYCLHIKPPIALSIQALIFNPYLCTFCFNTPFRVNRVIKVFSCVANSVSEDSPCRYGILKIFEALAGAVW